MSSERIRETILDNAKRINALKKRMDDALPLRNHTREGLAAWRQACGEFDQNYAWLSFPGGQKNLLRLKEGEPDVVEAALCFAECRPYFFRSGYMMSWILKKLKRAPMSQSQAERFQKVLKSREEWRKKRSENKKQ